MPKYLNQECCGACGEPTFGRDINKYGCISCGDAIPIPTDERKCDD